MKKAILILVTISLLCDCKQESPFDGSGFSGEGTALLNDVPWSGKSGIFPARDFCEPDTCIVIKITYLEDGQQRGDIVINYVPLGTGKKFFNVAWPYYKRINNRFSYSTWASDGDVITGGYRVVAQNEENYLDITELDLKTGDVKGNFQAVVVRDSIWTQAGEIPDTIRISNGVFYGKIYWDF